jgi:ABC-type transport system involved in cytochrome c biogenesis permease component
MMLMSGETEALITILVLYMVPAIVAYLRRHRSAHAILFVTLALGWTGFGWLWAAIWSLTGNVRRQEARA